jgi:hypothetical protein
MEGKYGYYKTAGQTWKVRSTVDLLPSISRARYGRVPLIAHSILFPISQQSVRHHLSLNRLFERQPRPVTDPGFGSYWTVNLDAPPGTKRPRKRGRPNANKDAAGTPGSRAEAKRRGRPPKDGVSGASSALMRQGQTPDEDEFPMDEDIDAEPEEDHYETEGEEGMPPHQPETGLSASAGPSRGYSDNIMSRPAPPFPYKSGGGEEEIYNELQQLRRQSSDAVALSIRLTDQLSQAQSEASRARSSLKNVEDMLGEEVRKRKEAERMADEVLSRGSTLEQEIRELKAALDKQKAAAGPETS